MMRTANPAWRNHAFDGPGGRGGKINLDYNALGGAGAAGVRRGQEGVGTAHGAGAGAGLGEERAVGSVMTLQGAVNKTFILLCLCAGAAVFGWSVMLPGSGAGQATAEPLVNPLVVLLGGGIGGLVVAMVTVFRPRLSPFTAPVYALLQGTAVGAISAVYAARFGTTEEGVLSPNYTLVFSAVTLTFGILAALLIAYTSRIIKPTENFKLGVVAATGGVMILYLASFVMGMFGVSMPFLHDSGPLGIGISAVIVIIAALNLVLDFDFIEQGAARGLPKYMEWYAGFGLLVTLVWLYLEVLRLLSKLQSRE